MLVVCEPDLETLTLSLALRSIQAEVYRAAIACAVPPAELEDILWTALLAVPEGLIGRALENRLLAEVRHALAAWRASMALWDRRGDGFMRAMEEGGIRARDKRPKRKKRWR
jgi:hypothetical protein